MFEVLNEDDAWDLGVLRARGLVEGSAKELGVPIEFFDHFAAGQKDHAALAEPRVKKLQYRWDIVDDFLAWVC